MVMPTKGFKRREREGNAEAAENSMTTGNTEEHRASRAEEMQDCILHPGPRLRMGVDQVVVASG
jgi:hypothetical protein